MKDIHSMNEFWLDPPEDTAEHKISDKENTQLGEAEKMAEKGFEEYFIECCREQENINEKA